MYVKICKMKHDELLILLQLLAAFLPKLPNILLKDMVVSVKSDSEDDSDSEDEDPKVANSCLAKYYGHLFIQLPFFFMKVGGELWSKIPLHVNPNVIPIDVMSYFQGDYDSLFKTAIFSKLLLNDEFVQQLMHIFCHQYATLFALYIQFGEDMFKMHHLSLFFGNLSDRVIRIPILATHFLHRVGLMSKLRPFFTQVVKSNRTSFEVPSFFMKMLFDKSSIEKKPLERFKRSSMKLMIISRLTNSDRVSQSSSRKMSNFMKERTFSPRSTPFTNEVHEFCCLIVSVLESMMQSDTNDRLIDIFNHLSSITAPA